jgi:hypothetical protein
MSKQKYPSKYSNGKDVSAAQYITEMICEKKAKREGKDLHYRFWINKEWSAFYRNQIASANKLVKQYKEIAIIKALNNVKAEKIYSLRAPHLIAIIEQEERVLASKNNDLSLNLERKQKISYNKSRIHNNNIISKLKDLE